MSFIHFFIFPVIFFLFTLFIQKYLDKKDFLNLIKTYLFGIMMGIIFYVVTAFFNKIFWGKLHLISQFVKNLIYYGLLFSILLYISNYLSNKLLSTNYLFWVNMTILNFSLLLGFFTYSNYVEINHNQYANNIMCYISQLAYILFLSTVSGILFVKIAEAYSIINKIVWYSILAAFLIICNTLYFWVLFYDFPIHYFSIVLAVVILLIYENLDFKFYRFRISKKNK